MCLISMGKKKGNYRRETEHNHDICPQNLLRLLGNKILGAGYKGIFIIFFILKKLL